MVHEVSIGRTFRLPQIEWPRLLPNEACDRTEARLKTSPRLISRPRLRSSDLNKPLARVREVFHQSRYPVAVSVDPDLDRVIVKIMDGDSGEVIRQIPAKEVLDLAKSLEASNRVVAARSRCSAFTT